jgi:hypothetical protein
MLLFEKERPPPAASINCQKAIQLKSIVIKRGYDTHSFSQQKRPRETASFDS